MKKNIFLTFTILTFSISTAFTNTINYLNENQENNILINTKHTGSVLDIASDSKYIFTAGEDGRLKVWDINTLDIIKDIKITPYSINKIEIYPESTEILIMVSAGSNNFFLTLWDWENEKMIFRHRLEDKPLQFSFSPKKDYIIYSTADINSLRILDAKSGNRIYNTILPTGLISHYTINTAQTVIATYNQSGRVNYTNLTTGDNVFSTIVEKNLIEAKFLNNAIWLVGRTNDRIVAENVLRPNESKSIEVPRILNAVADDNKFVFYTYMEDNRIYAAKWNYETNKNTSLNLTHNNLYKMLNFSINKDQIIAGGNDGNITIIQNSSAILEKDMANTEAITSATFFDNTYFFTAGKDLYKFANAKNFAKPEIVQIDGLDEARLFTSNDAMYLYGNKTGKVMKYIPEQKDFRFAYQAESGIKFFKVQNNFIVQYLDSDYIQLINTKNYSLEFEYRSASVKDAVITNSNNLYLSYNKIGNINSTVLLINTKSGESLQIDTNEQVTSQLLYNPNTDTIYTLGLENVDNQVKAVIKTINNEDWGNPRAIFVANGEDNYAKIAMNPEEYYLYTNLSDGTIKILKWSGFTPVEEINENSVDINIVSDFIISFNKNGSLTFFDIKSGKNLLEVYILKDRQWLAISNGKKFKSKQVDEFIID